MTATIEQQKACYLGPGISEAAFRALSAEEQFKCTGFAVRGGQLDVIRQFTAWGYVLSSRDLTWAIRSSCVEAVAYVIAAGIEPRTVPHYLRIATHNSSLPVLRYLFERDPTRGRAQLAEAIPAAIENQRRDMLHYLVARGPVLDAELFRTLKIEPRLILTLLDLHVPGAWTAQEVLNEIA